MTGKVYKNRPLRVKDQLDPVANKHFVPMKRLLKPREVKVVEMTKEEMDSEMKKDLKDKLIPYHSTPYDEQIRLKSEHLKEIFYKFINRIEKEVISGSETALPKWLTTYWLKLNEVQNKLNETKELPEGEEKEIEDNEEEKEVEKEGEKEGEDNEEEKEGEGDNKSGLKLLPCDFEGVIRWDEDHMQGYRNKIEFTIGRNYEDNQLCVGFLKANATQGLFFVDYPKDLPHISKESVECAEKLQQIIRKLEEDYGLTDYNWITHKGSFRTLIYKESKRTNEKLISVVITRDSMLEGQFDEFKQALQDAFNDPSFVSISIIHSMILSGGYDYADKITYLTERKTYMEIVNGFKFSVSPLAFFQVNTHVFEKMLNKIKEWGNFNKEKTVLLDVWWGTGVIGIALSNYVKKIIGVEIIQAAIDDCHTNCELNDLKFGPNEKWEYYAGKAEERLPEIVKELKGKQVIAIVDPPRSGLHIKVLHALRRTIGLDKVIYVSWNANSLAENLYHLSMPVTHRRKAPEFRPIKFWGADLFPYSPHVECIMLLERYYICFNIYF